MILTASLCGTALCAMYYLKEQYDYTIRRMPPGPSSIPFIGNALSIDCNAPHLSMLELAKKYGNIFSIKLGSQRVVILNSCEVIKEAYKGLDISHRPNIYCMDVLVGDKGFLTCKDTNQWRLHTKLCRSALRVINNSSLGIKISEEADCLINKMLDYHGKAFNPCQDLYLASLNILCNISFGERYSHNDPELHEILDYSAQILKVISPVHPVNALPWLRHFPNKWFDSLLKAKDKRDRLLMRKYVQHVATYKDGEVRDMLDAMLASAKQAVQEKDENSLSVLTPEHIIINMWLMFFAGWLLSLSLSLIQKCTCYITSLCLQSTRLAHKIIIRYFLKYVVMWISQTLLWEQTNIWRPTCTTFIVCVITTIMSKLVI